jgi:beta-lactamase superfamily II metal-dependent hydrolase
MLPFLLIALFMAPTGLLRAQSANLNLYWIDVEGGASTLVVSPSGESLLIDTGWAEGDRDAKRIYAMTQTAGVKKIDFLVMSHFHADHAGGLSALSKMIPIGRFYDRGDAIEPENRQWLDRYRAVSAGKRTVVKPGDTIPIQGVQVVIVSSNQEVLASPINGGGPNPLCADAEQKASAGPENGRGVGVLLTFGKFKYLNLIDLDWQKEMELACPVNKLGKVTLYQTGRHGSFDGAGAPALLGAIQPQVVVVNNGPRKGLGQVDANVKSDNPPGKAIAPYEKNAYLRLAKLPGIEGIWQEHLSLLDPDPRHNTAPDMIANLEDSTNCKGNWIQASVARDGKFTLTNGRNGFSKTYAAR